MPYIKQKDRDKILLGHIDATPGTLNYLITEICKNYLDAKGLSYATINDIVGALEGAKLEFYRRVAGPYENGKISENGDVY